jgi:predicted nucleotidyltransferase
MERDAVLAVLRAHRSELLRRGVLHVALFGSVARGEEGPASDIDLLVDLDPQAPIDVFGYVGLVSYVQGLFDRQRVDVANRKALKPRLRPVIERDEIRAF